MLSISAAHDHNQFAIGYIHQLGLHMTQDYCLIGIYGTANHEIFHRPVSGVFRYCEQHGGFKLIDFRMIQLLDVVTAPPPPWRGKVQGVITGIGHSWGLTEKQTADWALSGGVPVVSVTADWYDPRVPMVCVSPTSIAALAADHLIECGSKSFLYFGFTNSAGSHQRSTEFAAALQRHKKKCMDVESTEYYAGSFEDEATLERETQLADYLVSLPKPIGVWALNDNYARAVCLMCERLKLQIPAQVKVLGVDDLAVSRTFLPTISSIRTPREEVGFRAMRELHKLIQGKRGSQQPIEIDATELVARDSTLVDRPCYGDMQTVLDYIAQHACAGVTVEQILSLVGGSQRALSEHFRTQVGHSISDEIQRVRLEHAKSLLAQTHLSMTRIASMVGYAETAAFSKFFRKATGISPRAYRDDKQAQDA